MCIFQSFSTFTWLSWLPMLIPAQNAISSRYLSNSSFFALWTRITPYIYIIFICQLSHDSSFLHRHYKQDFTNLLILRSICWNLPNLRKTWDGKTHSSFPTVLGVELFTSANLYVLFIYYFMTVVYNFLPFHCIIYSHQAEHILLEVISSLTIKLQCCNLQGSQRSTRPQYTFCHLHCLHFSPTTNKSIK